MGERSADVDAVVIGGGLCASLAALELARAKKKVVVVSAGPEDDDEPCLGHVPSGPPLPYVDAVQRWGHAAARDLWETQREAQAELRQLARELREEAGWRGAGDFTLALDRAAGTALATGEDMLRDDGFAGEFLDGYMLEARFDVRALSAGYWAEAGAELDLDRLAAAAGAAARAAGVTFARSVAKAELSADGVAQRTGNGTFRAPVAILATAAAAARLAPYFDGRLDTGDWRALGHPGVAGSAIPSPARLAGLRAAWTVVAGTLRLGAVGADPAALAAAHLTGVSGPAALERPRRVVLSADGLPWVGAVPGLAAIAAVPGGPDLGYLPLVPRWAVSALLTGRDTTPARLRTARTPSAML